MADKIKAPKAKLNIAEYNKNKALREKNRLKLHYPTLIKVLVTIPIAYFLFLLIYFLTTAKNIPEF